MLADHARRQSDPSPKRRCEMTVMRETEVRGNGRQRRFPGFDALKCSCGAQISEKAMDARTRVGTELMGQVIRRVADQMAEGPKGPARLGSFGEQETNAVHLRARIPAGCRCGW